MDILKQKIRQYLCPPGEGVFTVNTAKERKEELHRQLFGDPQQVRTHWEQQIDQLKIEEQVYLLGICSDVGGGILRGANWGPLFLRLQLLEQYPELKTTDLGDVRVIPHLLTDEGLNSTTLSQCRQALYSDPQSSLPVSALSITKDFCQHFYQLSEKAKLFAMGGDHSVSFPLVKAYLEHKKQQKKRSAIIHFDAHTDLLDQRLGIDICFGSWAYHILNDLYDPSLLIQIGIRSSARDKKHWEKTLGVTQWWSNEVKQLGAEIIAEKIIEQLKHEEVEELYVSFDIDALDIEWAGATGTPEKGGLEPHQALHILDLLQSAFPVTGADMVEIAPFVQHFDQVKMGKEPLATLQSGAAISSFLIQSMSP